MSGGVNRAQDEIEALEERLAASEAESRRAEQARLVWENSVFQEAMERLDDRYLKAWRAGTRLSPEERERIWVLAQLVDVVKSHIKTVLDGGEIARDEIAHSVRHLQQARGRMRAMADWFGGR